MAANESFAVKYGETEVKVYARGDERWSLNWRQLGKRKSSTFRGSKKEADKRARAIAMEASRINLGLQPARLASKVEVDVLERLTALIGERELSLAVSDLESGVAKAGSWKLAIQHLHTYRPDVADVPIDGLYHRFMVRYDKLETTSAHNPRKELSAVIAAHPDLLLSGVTQEFLEVWLDRGDPAPLYYNTRLIVWRNFLSRCRDWGYISEGVKHVADKIPKRRKDFASPPIISIDQMERGLDLLKGAHLAGFAVACFSGLRPSEIGRLKWADVKKDYIYVRAETSKKVKAERYVPMQPKLWAILKGVRKELEKKSKTGLVCSKFQWIKISRHLRAGKKPVLESWPMDLLRHSYISYRLAQTASISQVADEAGNSPDVIRDHYRRPLKRETGEKWFALAEGK
ncbi:hypothetical protein ACFPK9_04985 [Rubritalea spongiae]|uniref:Tyr recombinase domain-containing protein n=1 Tax=Rubritalea spongiae TaxID=430797 RepID=A0ABW5E8J8_9BACT